MLSRALFATRAAWKAGERDSAQLSRILRRELAREAIEVEYAELRDPEHLELVPRAPLERARALIAARVGRVRLIDNLELSAKGDP